MKTKLQEALAIVEDICCDINGAYPVGLVRVRRLLKDVLADWWVEDEIVMLSEEPPTPAA
jgi:hypothetical protein